MRRVLAIVNPVAGSGAGRRVFEQVERGLKRAGLAVEASLTAQAGDARRAAAQAAGCDVVVSIGGDGTLNEVVNGLEADLPVAPCPLGTANVLAKELGVPRSVARFCEMVRAGRERVLDLGAVNGQRFVSMTGAGFDASVTAEVHAARRGAIRMSGYFGPLLRHLARYPFPRLKVRIDGGEVVESAGFALVSNVRSYGGPLVVAPDAVPDDGLLDVCTLPRASRLAYVRALAAFFLRCQHSLSGARYHRGRSIEVTADERVPYQADGDPAGWLPARIELLERTLRVVVP